MKKAAPRPAAAKRKLPWQVQYKGAILAVVLAVVLAVLYVGGQRAYGLFDVDEAIFTQASREMLTSHNWAVPTYNGEPRYAKPPMIYWLQAGAMHWLGDKSLMAARLPSVVGAIGTILLLGWGVWRLTHNRRWAIYAAGAMALNISFLVVGRAATADGTLNFLSLALVMAVLFQVYRPWRGPWKNWQWVLTAFIAALGLLAKGPVAWISAGFVGLALLAVRPDRGEIWARVKPLHIGLFAMLMLVPALAVVSTPQGLAAISTYAADFLLTENGQRFLGGFKNSQSHSWLFYPLVILGGFLPWSLLLPRALRWAQHRGHYTAASPDASRALPALCLAWALGVVVVFSFSQTKLAHYVVPAWPALSIIVAGWLTNSRREANRELVVWGVFGMVVLGLFGLALLALAPALEGLRSPVLHGWLAGVQSILGFGWPPKNALTNAALMQNVTIGPFAAAAGLVVLLGVIPAWWHVCLKGRKALVGLAGAWAVVLALIVYGVVPVVWAYTQKPLAVLAGDIQDLPRDMPIIHLGLHKPSVLYLSGHPFRKLEKPLQLPAYVQPGTTVAVLTELPTVEAIRHESVGMTINVARCIGGYCLLMINRGEPQSE
ncbi:MAG TPA: glycosyltransferase family 39 protein [Alphaproteobacteria bacterium]|nr:glycosyltransferase family 39 protein [Alphaproteobacteria bacterium]